MDGALAGTRIIELSQVLAGPFCGYQFALLGAEVIKVEPPGSPDCARGRGPVPDLNARGLGLTYQAQGGNKKSLALNIWDARGRDALLRLVDSADVLLENYKLGVLEGLGLGYEAVRARNPRIVYCSMTGYGDQGSKAGKGAYDNTIQAASGVIDQCGGVKPGVSFVDYAAGYSAAFSIAAALLQRERTGEGCHISTSMLEVAISLMAPEAAAKQIAPEEGKLKEAGISSYETAEGVLMLGAFKPSQYRKLGSCLSRLGYEVPELTGISEWRDVWDRSGVICEALQAVFLQRPANEWVVMLEEAGVPAERVLSLDEALGASQLAARGYFVASPDDTTVTLPLAAYRMSRGGPALTSAPPVLGQDSHATLVAAGLSELEVSALMDAGVVK